MDKSQLVAKLEAKAQQIGETIAKLDQPGFQMGWLDSSGQLVSAKEETINHFRSIRQEYLHWVVQLRSEMK